MKPIITQPPYQGVLLEPDDWQLFKSSEEIRIRTENLKQQQLAHSLYTPEMYRDLLTGKLGVSFILLENNRHAGSGTIVYRPDLGESMAELTDAFVLPKKRQKGLGMLITLTRLFFLAQNTSYHYALAYVDPDNRKSRHILEKTGFIFYGTNEATKELIFWRDIDEVRNNLKQDPDPSLDITAP